ncbi:MAG: hypothetical protein NTY46_03035 [Candidatus Sumerlaeota bacterium]|nr:hypothetical protein [Candidatus Sumerlaeota bacterium]
MTAEFKPNAIYTLAELETMLAGVCGADTFIERLKIPKRFKYGVLGNDIIHAMQNPPDNPETARAPAPGIRNGKRGRPRKAFLPITLEDIFVDKANHPAHASRKAHEKPHPHNHRLGKGGDCDD